MSLDYLFFTSFLSRKIHALNFEAFPSSDHMDRFPSSDPFLSVGTYILGSEVPARGHAVIFDTASSGWIYPTAGYIVGSSTYTGNMLQLESPVSVNMDNITLTREAIGVTIGVDAYILDKVNLVGLCRKRSSQIMRGPRTNMRLRCYCWR